MRQESSSSLGDRLADREAAVAKLTEELRAAGVRAETASVDHAKALGDRDAAMAALQAASQGQLADARAAAARQLEDRQASHEAATKVGGETGVGFWRGTRL